MPKLNLNDQTIFYTYNQVPDKPVLLLIHGAGNTHLAWPGELRRLSETAVIAIDLPGHGQSPPPGCTTIDGYADIVAEIVAAFGSPQTVLVGHSMGGAIVQTLAVRQPAWLTGLILVGTGPKMPVSPAILDQIYTDYPAVADFITKYSWGENADHLLRGMARRFILEIAQEVTHGDFVACNQFDSRQQLGRIQVPTLIIGGANDKMIPLKQSHFLKEHIPDAQLDIIEGAGHQMALEKPEEIVKLIGRFIRQLQGS